MHHGSRLATFVQAALSIAIPLLGSTEVMIGSVADSFSLKRAPVPTFYACQPASRSVNMLASITVDATTSFALTTQSFLSATVVLFAIIWGGMVVYKCRYHRQEEVEEEGEQETEVNIPRKHHHHESNSEGDDSTSDSSRPTSPPGGDGDDDPPPSTNYVDYDIPSRSGDCFNVRVLLVVVVILCAFLRTFVFITVKKRQSVRQIVVLGVEALDRGTQNLRSSVGVALERPEWLKSLLKSSVLVFWTRLGSTTTEEVQEWFLEEMKSEEVIKGSVHEEDTTITHKHAFGHGSSPSSRGVVVLSNVQMNVEPIQELVVDYPIPASVSTSTTVTTPSSSVVASSTPVISSNSIAILTPHVTTSLSSSLYPHTTAALSPPLTEVTIIYALHYFET
ncbi:hypothetical protein BDN72DRAFT_905828 [Pluteus cervinus]|uniref:Uncharacterized protein n=1 Tax=Pluteus cervinus TaxID=181527 RepID=A0ACD3A256_9AGAR|nr:hypothetical protein BDN72DRAFT_905828 [Pluteus cervinus]